jgi:UDP-glucose 4-epimerase
MGFIASHTAQALADLGHGCVVASHRSARDLSDTMSIEQVDSADRDALLGLGERHAIGGIVPLADPALARLGDLSAGPATLVADMRAGADALFNVLECAIAWDVRRVTVASTIGVYGGLPNLEDLAATGGDPKLIGGRAEVQAIARACARRGDAAPTQHQGRATREAAIATA